MPVRSLRDAGIEPMAVNCYLARLGTGEPAQPRLSLDELAADFDIARYGRAMPKLDEAQLQHLNQQILHESPYEAVAARLEALGLAHADRAFWEAVRANLHRLADAKDWYEVCFGEVTPLIEDPEFAQRAARLLPPEPWSEATWDAWTRAVRTDTGRKGKELFLPLRLALTGRPHGPELRALLPLIGRRRAERRLPGKTPEPAAAIGAAGA